MTTQVLVRSIRPYLHVLCSDGCFCGNGMFRVAPLLELRHLEEILRHKVFKMLLSKGKITEDLVDMLMKWHHSGFNVFCGSRIRSGSEKAMENLAWYIIRASFSPGKNVPHSTGVKGHLPVQGRERRESL